MDRLTHKHESMADWYQSAATRDKLIQRLAQYENTGLEPWEINQGKRGEWIANPKNPEWLACSVCRKEELEGYNFCPNCGAKMDWR